MGAWTVGLGALGAAITSVLLANSDLLLPNTDSVSITYLSGAQLKTLNQEERTFTAGELWRQNGAVIMAVRRPG